MLKKEHRLPHNSILDLTKTSYRYLLLILACMLTLGNFFTFTSLGVLENEIRTVI